jgi:hypothetical protein
MLRWTCTKMEKMTKERQKDNNSLCIDKYKTKWDEKRKRSRIAAYVKITTEPKEKRN